MKLGEVSSRCFFLPTVAGPWWIRKKMIVWDIYVGMVFVLCFVRFLFCFFVGFRECNIYPGSPKTKLCPLVGSGILYMDHPKNHSLFGLGLPGYMYPFIWFYHIPSSLRVHSLNWFRNHFSEDSFDLNSEVSKITNYPPKKSNIDAQNGHIWEEIPSLNHHFEGYSC